MGLSALRAVQGGQWCIKDNETFTSTNLLSFSVPYNVLVKIHLTNLVRHKKTTFKFHFELFLRVIGSTGTMCINMISVP